MAATLNGLGNLTNREGKYDEARGYFERALVIWEKALGPDHLNVAAGLNNLGIVAEKQGNYDEARGHFERALAIGEKALGPDHLDLAETRFALARALWDAGPEAGRDRERAKTLAMLAHTAYAEAGEGSAKQLEEVQAWQREHAS